MDFWTGIIVCLDEISTQRIKNLQKILSESPDIHGNFNIQIPPHITFYEHTELRKQEYFDALQSMINFVDSFTIEFTGLTTFPATHIFYLNPKYCSKLHDLRKMCLETFIEQGILLDRHPNGMWSPHLTLLSDLPTKDISKAIEITQNYLNLQIDAPFKAKIDHIEIFSYPPYKAEQKFFLHKL
jgi:2'-5' RNA ligase